MRSRFLRRTFVVALVALAAACDTESSRARLPTGPSGAAPFLTTFRVTGPDTVHIDEPSQFTATATYSDGTAKDVTAQTTWRTITTGLMTMTGPGLFTGAAKGEAAINAAFDGRVTTLSNIIVVPSGTYRVRGTVRDSGLPVDAHLEITSAASGRLEFDTGPQGTFTVYGVGGDTQFTASKPGYERFSRTEVVTGHRSIDIDLRLERSRADVSGRYTLTITAADECSALPADARTRTYTATIQQTGPVLRVKLTDQAATGASTRDEFTGVLEAQRAVFQMRPSGFYYYYYLPFVIEVIPPGVYYGLDGVATTSISADDLSGTVDGAITTYANPGLRELSTCRSANHRLQFRR